MWAMDTGVAMHRCSLQTYTRGRTPCCRPLEPFRRVLRMPFSSRKPLAVTRPHCCAAAPFEETQLQDAKYNLLKAVQETDRGFNASTDQRAFVEESMVAVEAFNAGTPLDLNNLDGTWLLQYTTASDVLSILQAARVPFLEVGQIFQKFECYGNLDEGLVRNVVRWSVPGVLQDADGATLTVTAKFFVASSRNIALEFEEAALGSIMMSEQLQGLIAPALLPRTSLNLEILQLIRGFTAKFPLRTRHTNTLDRRAPLGLLYYISFVDSSMLIGRALGNGGIFIFSRTQPLQSY
ncbi:hypothetical protein L7F22_015329 [Adiantum nelumboides]|nr:hypothetical protein [Adiantum nelumboides]